MAETAGTIQLSVQFKDAISNFKKVVDSLQGELNKLTPGTSIYKAIESDLKQAQKLVNKTDLQANTGLNKIGQLDTMVGDLQRVEGLLSRVQQLFGSVDLSHVNLNHESFAAFAQDIQAAKTELANLAKAKSELEGKNIKGLLASAGYTEAQMKKAGFKAGDLDQNAIEYYQRLGQAAAEAQQKVESLNQAQKSAQTLVNNNQAFLDSNKNAATIGSLTKQLTEGYKNKDIVSVYGNFLDQQHQQGTLQGDHVQNALRLLGLDDATINSIISAGADARKRLEEGLKARFKKTSTETDPYRGLQAEFNRNLADPTRVGANTGGVSGRTGFSTALKQQEKATEEQLKHQQEVAQLQKETAAAEKQVAKLETKSSTLGNVISKTDYANLNTQINNIQSRIATLEAKILGNVQSAGLTPPGDGGGGGIPNPPPDDPGARAQDAKQQAQEQMGNAINMMARRWLGTYAIVNKVRQAIRQAWTDIKALDKSMTNIAVVTNMSVNDLWGKINDYMSIAQQYGVSTQGVYEVSQLYYQQGLGTADVMAATTETLKMARIAGMDYAEAADAMTVAIRSFKMEMSDAAHVTDVYSKVAAVTASDSEELAIAMSKTASSAESVGSSFENTTAMLAVMIETTRESAQNLGSALKSIISRYGEMKVGATVDAEGEALDYNKVDTALKSIGISIKDAQGQFRDFDEVIFELSEKWDSLDSVTQRYIATIMAGNRQQSRFIALVDNWERLDEVAGAAQDSEDAGLLQYAKTLDSLESKISNLKTSFQQFYMDIANGPLFKSILTFLNNVVQGFTKVGKLFSVTTIANLILSVKSLFSIMAIMAKSTFADMYANYRAYQEGKTAAARQGNAQRSQDEIQQDQQTQQQMQSRRQGRMKGKYTTGAVYGAQIAGSALSLTGASIVGKGGFENYKTGTLMSTAGNMLSMGATGFMMGGGVGAVIGVLAGIVTSLQSVAKIFDKNYELQLDYEAAKKDAEEKNVKRAESKDQYNNLKTLLKQYEEAEKTKYDDEESYQNWLDINNQLVEAYPELLGYIDAEGNAIADVTKKTEVLGHYMERAAEASRDYYNAKVDEVEAEIAKYRGKQYKIDHESKRGITPYDSAAPGFHKIGVPLTTPSTTDNIKSLLGNSEPTGSMNYTTTYIFTLEDIMTAIQKNGINLQDELHSYNEDPTSTEYADVIKDLIQVGLLKENSKGNGYYTFTDDFKNYYEAFYLESQLGTYKKGGAQANLSLLLSSFEGDEAYEDLDSYVALLYQYASNISEYKQSDFKLSQLKKDDDVWSKIIEGYTSLFSDLTDAEQAILEEIYANIGNLSLSELTSKFSQGLDMDENQDLYNTIIAQWYNSNYSQAVRWIGAYNSTEGKSIALTGDFANGLDFENWRKTKEKAAKDLNDEEAIKKYNAENAANLYEEYYKELEEVLAKESDPFYSFIKQNQDSTIEAYLEYLRSDNKIIETKAAGNNVASARKQKINQLISDSLNKESALYQLFDKNAEARAEFWSLLFTDTGSYEWADKLEEFEKIYNINLNTDFTTLAYENFSTYVNSLGENIQKEIDSIESLYDSQTKGFELEKAIKLFEDIKEPDETWYDIFTYTKEGKLVLKNFDEALERQKANTIERLEKMNTAYSEATSKLLKDIQDGDSWKDLTKEILTDPEKYGYTSEMADSIISWINENTNATEKEFTNFLNQMGTILQQAQKYYTESSAAVERESKQLKFKIDAANAAAALEGEYDPKKEVYSLLAQSGFSGYSADNAGKLIAAGLFSQSDFKEQADGTYNLNEAAQAKIASMPRWVQNAINRLITSSVDDAIKNIESLGSNVFEATDTDYSEAFSYLTKAGFQGKDIKQGINYALMEAIVGDPKDLENYIGRQLAHEMGRNYDEDPTFIKDYGAIITETRENMVAASKDQITKQYGRFAEILQKKILGTATFEELEELNDLELKLNLDLSSFTGRLVDDLTSFAQEIIDNAYLSTEDKQKYLQAAFGSILDIKAYSGIFGVDEKDVTPEMAAIIPDVYSSNEELRSSRNRLSQDKANELMTNYALAMGIRPETLKSLVTFNESDLTFSFGKGKTPFQMMKETIRAIAETDSELKKQLEDSGYDNITTIEELVKVIDDTDNAQALNVLGSIELFEQLADAQLQSGYFDQEYRAEKYISAVESFASGQEMTFEELTKLYQDLGLTFDTAELYRLWLSGPEALAAELLKLGTGSDSGLTDEQKKQIQNAQDRGVETLLNNIASIVNKVIEGSATLDDLFSLGKNLGINLSGKVYKTSSGYGLTQEGLVEVAGARAMRTGDYTTEGRLLVESYYGHGGMFDNVAALEAEIKSQLEKNFKFEATDLNIAGTLLRQASIDYADAIADWNDAQQEWEKETNKQKKDELKINAEKKKQIKEEKELNLAQAKILQAALAAATRREAENAANFMGIDPFDGAAEHYKNYKSSRETAQTALQEAYQNKGFIKDFNQAGQLLRFIGYGEGWDPETRREKLSTIFKYDSDKGVNFAAVLREVLGDSYNFTGMTDAEVLLKAAELMNQSEQKMEQKMYEDQLANETWGQTQKEIIADSKKRLVPEGTTVDGFITSKKVGEEMVSTLDSAKLSEYVAKTYGKLGLTKEAFEGLAKIRYGDDWKTALANTDTLKSFLQYIDKTTTGFKYDSSSDQTYEEQYLAHLQGDTAAQKVDERLKALEDHLSGLTTDASIMDGLNEGLDLSIEKAKFLNHLLSENELGTVLTTGTTTVDEQQQHSGYIQTKKQLEEVTDDEINKYKKHLATTYGLDETEAGKIKYNRDNHTFSYTAPKGSEDSKNTSSPFNGFTYTLKAADSNVPEGADPKPPLDGEVVYTGKFDEIDKWIAENKHIQAVYTLSTPEVAKNNVKKQIQAILEEYSVEDAAALSKTLEGKTGSELEKAKADLAELQALLDLQKELNTRYPDTDKEPGVVDLKINGKVPENDKELVAFKDMVNKTLEGLGDVPLTFTVGEGDGAKALDTKGLQEYINSLSEGQELVLSASVLEGTGLEDINAIAVAFNAIADNLKTAKISLDTTGLDDDKVKLINDLTAALKNYDSANPDGTQRNVTLNVIGAENADKRVKNLYDNLTQLDKTKEFNSALNLTVNLTDGKGNTVSYVDSYSNLLAENAQLIEDNGILTEEKNQLTQENATLEETIAANDAIITALEAEKAELAAALTEKSTEVESLAARIATIELENGQLAAEKASLNSQLSAADADKAALTERIANLESTIAANQIITDGLRRALFSAQQEKRELKDELALYEADQTTPSPTPKTGLDGLEGVVDSIGDYIVSQQQAIYESESPYAKRWAELNEDGLYQEMQRKAEGYWYNQDTGAIHRYTAEEQAEGQAYLEEYASIYANILAFEEQQDAQWQALDAQLTELYDIYEKIEKERAKDGESEESQITIAGLMDQLNSFIFGLIPGNTTEQTANVTTEANTEPFEKSADEIIAELEAMGVVLPVEADTDEALSAAQLVQRRINGLYAYLKVYAQYAGATGFPDGVDFTGDGGGEGGPVKYTGNVNGIAYADGNVDKLIKGAHLAHKTLVGELGPELGVWDGQYHLLGRNGAEFVNMPSDAIVFNHRQTEGILKGQMGHRGKALVDGNVGPARASSDGWQHVYGIWPLSDDFKSYDDFLKSLKSSGKKSVKTTDLSDEDLEEWYNLLRKIAKLEAEINLLKAERENMLDGHDILKSYREEQAYLNEQIAVQKLLIDYQKEQLKLEAERIKQDKWWSKSLTFNEDGTLLSIFGNEVGGGKGVFAYLDMLNNMSGDQQVAALKALGYSYKGKDGKALEGEELVKQFVKEYKEVVSDYNDLENSIYEGQTKVEQLTKAISDLETQITENQKELEKSIYDLLVDAAELEIEQMEEQHKLIQEANEKYIKGLNDALSKEKDLYESNQSIEKREALQRELSLLRRSGGSASEIAELEQQLDDTLKTEYFDKQQQMIEDINEANEHQTELMERQVKLQEDALEYQKENGVLWTKVYEILGGSYEEILAFFTGHDTEFFKASVLEQESMLLKWAKMVGIYDEDRISKQAKKDAGRLWEDGTIEQMLANDKTVSEYTDKEGKKQTKTRQQQYNELSDKDKKAAQDHYNAAYADAVLRGQDSETASRTAYDSMVERFRLDKDVGITRFDPRVGGSTSGSGNNNSGNTQYVNITYQVTPPEAKAAGCSISGPSRVAVGTQKGGIVVKTAKGWAKAGWTSSNSTVAQISSGVITAHKKGSVTITQKYWKRDDDHESEVNSQSETAIRDEHTGILEETFINKGGFKITNNGTTLFTSSEKYKTKDEAKSAAQSKMATYDSTTYPKLKYSLYGFSQGGLVDYTGIAVVHGSQSKPEAFLNASQTAQITEALRETTGKESVLEGLRSTMDKLRALVHNISTIDNSSNQNISIAPGAVVIQVEQLADSYDIDEVSRDVMNRMVTIANKATNRGVSRR